MIKVMLAVAKENLNINGNPKFGFYKKGEVFLQYKNRKGNIVGTTPMNASERIKNIAVNLNEHVEENVEGFKLHGTEQVVGPMYFNEFDSLYQFVKSFHRNGTNPQLIRDSNIKKVYFGSPLFSDMERQYNEGVVKELRELFVNTLFYLPQENDAINDKTLYADSQMIAQADTKELLESNVLVAVLDGPTIDVGLASEIGVAYAKNIPIIGLYTDSRVGTHGNLAKIKSLDIIGENQFAYANLYTIGLIKSNGYIVSSVEELIEKLSEYGVK